MSKIKGEKERRTVRKGVRKGVRLPRTPTMIELEMDLLRKKAKSRLGSKSKSRKGK